MSLWQHKTAAAPCRHSCCSILLASEPGALLSFSACTGTTTHDFIIEKTDEFCKSFPAKSTAGFYGHAELTVISTALYKTIVKFLSILP
jgi:hypothetical protein